jgi:hypothetical protein
VCGIAGNNALFIKRIIHPDGIPDKSMLK